MLLITIISTIIKYFYFFLLSSCCLFNFKFDIIEVLIFVFIIITTTIFLYSTTADIFRFYYLSLLHFAINILVYCFKLY